MARSIQIPVGIVSDAAEGDVRVAVATDHRQGLVRIVCDAAVTWLGLPAGKARDLARLLIEKADELDQRKA